MDAVVGGEMGSNMQMRYELINESTLGERRCI
jgi:hypothetical protein